MRALVDYFHPLQKLKRARERYLKKHVLADNIKSLLTAPLPGLDDDLYHTIMQSHHIELQLLTDTIVSLTPDA